MTFISCKKLKAFKHTNILKEKNFISFAVKDEATALTHMQGFLTNRNDSPAHPSSMAWSCVLRLEIADDVASVVTELLFEEEFTTEFEVGLPLPAAQSDETLLQELAAAT